MNLTDFPIELQVSFLQEGTLEELLNYSLINKEAYQICSTNEFLQQYVYQKYHLDLNRIPGETSWEALRYLFFLIGESDCLYYDEELMEETDYRSMEDLSHFISEIIELEYPELFELLIGRVIDTLGPVYDVPDIGNIEALRGSFEEAKRIGDPRVINIIFRYYVPPKLIGILKMRPDQIKETVEQYPCRKRPKSSCGKISHRLHDIIDQSLFLT